MIRLTDEGVLWRNFFFANHKGYFKADYDEFETRVSIISDAKEEIMEQILRDNPDNAWIEELKKEIEFQKEEMAKIIDGFIEYCRENNTSPSDRKELLADIVNNDFDSGLWKILEEWKPITKYINSVTDKLEELYGGELDLRDDVTKIMMDNMQDVEARRLLTEKLHLIR